MEQLTGPLVYESPIEDVFVLDLPISIQRAQCSSRNLISCSPLQVPFQSLEAKSAKAKLNVRKRQIEGVSELNATYVDIISAALNKVRGADIKDFCLDRLVNDRAETLQKSSKKRKRSDRCIEVTHPKTDTLYAAADVQESTSVSFSIPAVAQEDDIDDFMKHLANDTDPRGSLWNVPQSSADIVTPGTSDAFVNNPTDTSIVLTSAAKKIKPITAAAPELNFHIPAHSAALNTPLESSINNLTALHTFLSHPHGRASNPRSNLTISPALKFSLLLLDPPWPNSSARNSQSYKTRTYSAASNHPDSLGSLIDTLLSLGLSDVLSENAYIAIWITNKASVRAAVLELFDACGAVLVEEWIWAKVTEVGEPICELRGSGRRPWEVLLIARRGGRSERSAKGEVEGAVRKREERKVTRRVVVAVPDLHSRKPCLKQLFERLLFGKGDGGAGAATPVLELFARYMVAGWMSWGDEALKFQWEGCWRDE